MRLKRAKPDKYYIVILSNPQEVRFVYTHFDTKDLAKQGVIYYMDPDGTYDVYKGSMIILMGLKPSKIRVPKYSPKAHRRYKKTNFAYKEQKLKGLGIRAHHFTKTWEPLPEDRKARLKFFKKGKSKVKYLILK